MSAFLSLLLVFVVLIRPRQLKSSISSGVSSWCREANTTFCPLRLLLLLLLLVTGAPFSPSAMSLVGLAAAAERWCPREGKEDPVVLVSLCSLSPSSCMRDDLPIKPSGRLQEKPTPPTSTPDTTLLLLLLLLLGAAVACGFLGFLRSCSS